MKSANYGLRIVLEWIAKTPSPDGVTSETGSLLTASPASTKELFSLVYCFSRLVPGMARSAGVFAVADKSAEGETPTAIDKWAKLPGYLRRPVIQSPRQMPSWSGIVQN